MREHLVIELIAIVIPVINVINEGTFLSWEVVTSPLATVGILLLVIFVGKLFAAPFHIDEERQKEIDELQKQLPNELNIEVDAKSYYGMVSGPYGRITEGGWLIVLQNVRITNRSKTDKVSLGFALKIGLKNSPSKRDDWTLNQDHILMLDEIPDTFLVGPLGIKPQESEKGYIGFLILPKIREFLGDEAIVYNKAELEITDHISNKNIKIVLPSNAYYEDTSS